MGKRGGKVQLAHVSGKTQMMFDFVRQTLPKASNLQISRGLLFSEFNHDAQFL